VGVMAFQVDVYRTGALAAGQGGSGAGVSDAGISEQTGPQTLPSRSARGKL
jgi:hypothetical protein